VLPVEEVVEPPVDVDVWLEEDDVLLPPVPLPPVVPVVVLLHAATPASRNTEHTNTTKRFECMGKLLSKPPRGRRLSIAPQAHGTA
jgi:hypothetical protein